MVSVTGRLVKNNLISGGVFVPKELTHWHIAREALQRGVPAQVGEIIACNPAHSDEIFPHGAH